MTRKIRHQVADTAKRKLIPGVIVDCIGNRCSVRIGKRGGVLHGVPFTGGPAEPGDEVYIDYTSGEPVVQVYGKTYSPPPDRKTIQPKPAIMDLPPNSLGGDGSGPIPGYHHEEHEAGGLDEMDLTDMTGLLETEQKAGYIHENLKIHDSSHDDELGLLKQLGGAPGKPLGLEARREKAKRPNHGRLLQAHASRGEEPSRGKRGCLSAGHVHERDASVRAKHDIPGIFQTHTSHSFPAAFRDRAIDHFISGTFLGGITE